MKALDLRCEFRREPLGIDSMAPRLSWILGADPDQRNQVQSAYRILVASSRTSLSKNQGDLWDSGKVDSAQQNNIAYAGKPVQAGQTCFWKVQVWEASGELSPWSATASWEMGLFDWKAFWLSDGKPVPLNDEDFYKEDPAPLFRTEFELTKPIRRARLYVTGLGYYGATLNGKKVGDHVLDPGWTKPDARVFYSTFDVTKQLAIGANCVGVMLGNGWYNPLPLRMWGNLNLRKHLVTGRPCFRAQLEVEYRDGTRHTVSSDQTWKVGDGPLLRNNVYLGEIYDARVEQPGWDKPGFGDGKWRVPGKAEEPVGVLHAQPQPPIRIIDTWHPKSINEPKPKVFVYDCGENFAGWIRLSVNLAKGTRVQMRFGELLYPDGTLNPMTSVAGQVKRTGVGGPGAPDIAWQSDVFIAKGGPEVYTPRFTFHGFRYVEVTGLDKALPVKSLTAMRLSADIEDAGTFECSNPMLNQIQDICRRTFRSNLFSVQSDCPHREKMGYGGDIAATSEAFMLNYDMAGFYAKVVADFADSARSDGKLTDTAPFMGIQYCGVVWAMAHPLLVDQLYRYYGDSRIAEEQYEIAKTWLLAVEKSYPDGIVTDGLSDHEGLAEAPAPEMVTPFYCKSAKILASMATRLGKTEDAARFDALANKIASAYRSRFVSKGVVGPGTQASQAIGLATGLGAEGSLAHLLKKVDENKGHLTTGILGTKFMLDELSRAGRTDVAYRIATQPGFPGWDWMLKNGATTLWEHWELSDNTFSHNHPMFGSVSEWMMKWLGGIQPAEDAVGFDRIVIAPQPVEGLDWVKSSYRSIRGQIVSNWKRVGKSVEYTIVIPPNCSATVSIVGLESKKIGSGAYSFVSGKQ